VDASVLASDPAATAPVTIPRVAPNAPAGGRHIAELDGIRALAIWLVLAEHLLFLQPATAAGRAFLPKALAAILSHGWLGVDLFFVLSGFLITGILLRTKDLGRGKYFRRFYLRRVLRILPLYFVVLTILFAAFGGSYGAYFAFCALLSANLASLASVPVPDAAGPFWSLAVEEQFYLFWPWLVLWLDARRLAVVAAVIVVAEPFVRIFATQADLELTWNRLDGLAMGALVAIWYALWDGRARSARKFGLSLLGIAVAISVVGQPFGINHEGPASTSFRITQAVCLFGALVVAAVSLRGHAALGWLRSPFAVTTAVLSYCIYLIHRPLVDLFTGTIGATAWFAELPAEAGTLFRLALVIAAAYGLAALSRRFLEAPFQRLGARL
jgi:peptidoglycan/LPS O-acetylase OafA/YrhL